MKPETPPTIQECLDAPAYSAVTQSWCAIESQDTAKLYITPPPKDRKKPKDPRFACLGYIQKLKGIPSTAKAILTWLVMERQWRPDRLIIVSFGLVADHFGLSRRQVIRLFPILEDSGCLRMVKRGGIKGGKRYEGNTYALGSLFDNLPPEESKKRPVTKMSPIKGSPSVTKMSIEQCQECHPLPIVSPYKNTHTKELPSAFTKENWLNRGKEKHPDWDADNMTSAFYSGEMKEGLNGNWPSFQDKCYHLRITSAKTTPAPAPKSWQRQPSKPQEPSCYSPPQKPLDYTDPKILEDSLYYALKNRDPIACITAGLDPAMVASAKERAEARLKPKTS